MTEADFIAALRTLPLHPGAANLCDDAAVIEIGGEALVLTHDMIAEGVHYLPGTDPADVAWKLVAVNLSDLAAKGAEPIGVMIGASLIAGSDRFVTGLREVLEAFAVPLIGGDTIAPAPGAPASFGCTAIGRATAMPVPRRSGARAGDALWVVGGVGAAMLGFESARVGEPRSAVQEAYLRPHPLLAEGRALRPYVSAMMDLSDGLLLDARRMAEASGCAVDIALDTIPFPAALHGAPREERLAAATWGDDYALLFAAPPGLEPPIRAVRIGSFAAPGADPLTIDGKAPPARLGWEHR